MLKFYFDIFNNKKQIFKFINLFFFFQKISYTFNQQIYMFIMETNSTIIV